MEGLVTLEEVVHDGTKVIAYASGDTFRSQERLHAHLKMAREHLAKMGDPLLAEEVSGRIKKAKERFARQRVKKLELALEEMEKIQATKKNKTDKEKVRVSETDPESRIMKQGGGGGYRPSYNVQISTDGANGVIVGAAASQSAADFHELIPATDRIESVLGKPEKMVADGGFSTRENVLAMADKKIDFYGSLDDGDEIAAGQMKRRGVSEDFLPSKFQYNPANDTYTCPFSKTLHYEAKEKRIGITHYRYGAKDEDCNNCPHKMLCCPKTTKGRKLTRGIEDPRVTEYRQKMETDDAKQIYARRGPKAEFPNAWLKAKIGLRQFRLCGRSKVQTEVLWAVMAYNVSQWIRLCFRPQYAKT